MTPQSAKPYLIRALYDWCVDNSFTPHIVVVVDSSTRVPAAYVKDGQIVLNIASYATQNLSITNEDISCQARFGGVAQTLYVPLANVAAIYARENGQGMAFELGAAEARVSATEASADDASAQDSAPAPVPAPRATMVSVPTSSTASESVPETGDDGRDGEGDGDKPTPPGRSHLRVIK